MNQIKQWSALFLMTPTILGPACLIAKLFPKVSFAWLRTWSDIMRQSIDLHINVIDRNQPSIHSTNTESNCGTLYVHLNQQTLLSVLLYMASLPFHKLIMNFEFAMIPFIGWCPTLIGGVPIIRQLPSTAKRALEHVIDDLQRGDSYCISIEGQRCGPDGALSPYKKGPVVIALKSQCDIIPFLTFGELKVWPYGTWTIHPHQEITVLILPRIITKGLSYDTHRHELVQRLRMIAEEEISRWEGRQKLTKISNTMR